MNKTKIDLNDNLILKSENIEYKNNILTDFLDNNTIYDSGTNGNGNWIRYKNGFMICTKKVEVVIPITASWGSLFESGDVELGDFSQPFIDIPVINVSNASTIGAGALIEAVFNISKTSAGKCWLCRGTSRDSTLPYVLNVIAIGKWK